MKFTAKVTVSMTDEQMARWAWLKGIAPTEEAIMADLWGRDMAPLFDGTCGQIAGVDISDTLREWRARQGD